MAGGYPLGQVQALRVRRTDLARRQYGRAQQEVRAATAALRAAQAARATCERELPLRENAAYTAIMHTVCTLKQLDAFHAHLAALGAELVSLVTAEADRAAHTRACEATAAAARTTWQLAEKAVYKLARHREQWEAARSLELARQEDMELEEIRSRTQNEAHGNEV